MANKMSHQRSVSPVLRFCRCVSCCQWRGRKKKKKIGRAVHRMDKKESGEQIWYRGVRLSVATPRENIKWKLQVILESCKVKSCRKVRDRRKWRCNRALALFWYWKGNVDHCLLVGRCSNWMHQSVLSGPARLQRRNGGREGGTQLAERLK